MDAKTFLAAAALGLAGCAVTETPENAVPLAAADCKVAPASLASSTGARPRRADSLDQRYAEMQLATSDYRMKRLQQPLGATSNVEDALRDCDAAVPGARMPEQPVVAPVPPASPR
jgi:hypothetical protein